nr:hypothetical protein [Tanacetum cinerariifolium]
LAGGSLRQQAALGAQASAADVAGGDRHAGIDRFPLHGGAQGVLPGAGHWRDSGDFRGTAIDFLRRHERAAAVTGEDHSARPRCG